MSDPVASKYGVDQVNKREQAVADQDIQFLEEEMQDVSVLAGQRMFTDVDMPQWWQTDPLLDLTNIRLPLVSGGGICEAEFFKIQGEIHSDELKKHMDMLYQGVAMIKKLEDPFWQGTTSGPVSQPQISGKVPRLCQVRTGGLISSDDKSGYRQMPLHPSMWEYVAFQFEEQVYCFCVTPFGIAEAPRKFTI